MSEHPHVPQKRPAFEPPAALVRPLELDPGMRRPVSTVAGATLVLLRAVTGAVWVVAVTFGWPSWLRNVSGMFGGDASTPSETGELIAAIGVWVFIGAAAVVLAAEALLGILILGGRNLPRVLVMLFSVVSICTAFAGWWVEGQDIRIQTTYVTLSLDILILLALSSRSSAAYARRRERR
jgi:hypothetical protein